MTDDGERKMTIEKAIHCLQGIKNTGRTEQKDFQECLDMAIRSLEMQKELAERCSGMDICQFVEDYDYEENDISEYQYEASVDTFLIDEVKEGEER